MPKVITCALVVESPDGILICHPTGSGLGRDGDGRVWSFPKGLPDDGERHDNAAARECFEETGLDLRGLESSFEDFGVWPYLKKKDIHFFKTRVEWFDPSVFCCKTGFKGPCGNLIDETDGWLVANEEQLEAKMKGLMLAAWILARESKDS